MLLTRDPSQRVAAGGSSGGIAAFSMAWFRPELFGVVISHIGSFVNIRGGAAERLRRTLDAAVSVPSFASHR